MSNLGYFAHTETPWVRGERLGIWSGKGKHVAACMASSLNAPTAEEKANADFIVIAVNAHASDQRIIAELRAALVDLLDDKETPYTARFERAREALAKAGAA